MQTQQSATPTSSLPPASQHITRFGSVLNRAPADVAHPRRVWFRLVTRDVDRHGTIIEPAGVDLTAFRLNPVFLWMHSSGADGGPAPSPDVVIGAVAEIEQTPDHLDIGVDFDDDSAATTGNEHNGLAEVCLRKVRAGLLRMVSISCNTLRPPQIRVVDGVEVPVFTSTELLEASLVIIGSNRNALKLNRAAALAMLRGGGDDPNPLPEPPPVKRSAQRQPDHVAAVAVFDADGKMLWGRRGDDNKWTTPGGHLDVGEDPAACAQRELREEAGLRAASMSYLGVVDARRGVGKPLHVHCFRAVVDGSAPRASSDGDPDGEVAEWRWVALEDGKLPAEIRDALHAPKNAFFDIGVIRRGVAVADPVLSTAVDGTINSSVDFVNGADSDFDALAGYLGDPDESDGLVVKSTPNRVNRTVVAHKAYPTVDKPWDADAAVNRWRKYSSSDGSGDKDKVDWAKFAQCFCWFDGDDRENFASYKLPHHDVVDGKPVTVWKGVVAAAAAIMGAHGGVRGIPAADVAKIKAHLGAHYREFDKTPPWVERTAIVMAKPVKVEAEPVHSGPAIPVDGFADFTCHALIFPASKFTTATAIEWAKEHGYFAGMAIELGTGYSHDGLCLSENSFVIDQLPRDLFQPGALHGFSEAPSQTFVTIGLVDGVWAALGLLKPGRLIIDEGRAAALCPAAVVSPSARAELRLSVARKDGDSAAAQRVLDSGTWLGGAFQSPDIVRHARRAAVAVAATRVDRAWLSADLCSTATERSDLRAAVAYARSAPYYLERKSARTHTTRAQHTPEFSQMKRSPAEVRARYQGAIHSSMECAAQHAGMLEDGFVADEHRAMHQAMAMRALDHAEEMHRMSRSLFIGDKASQDVVVDGAIASGEVYNLGREISDPELKTRFAAVSALIGKLPRQLRSVVQAELGAVDPEIVEEKLLSLKQDRANYDAVKRSAADSSAKLEQVELARMIEDAAKANLVTPAEIKRFHGIDAATDKPAPGGAWSKARVERYIADRAASGPVAPIVRPGMERNVAPVGAATTPAPATPSGVVRTAQNAPQMTAEQVRSAANEWAARLGIDPQKLLARTEAAAQVPSSDVNRYLPSNNA